MPTYEYECSKCRRVFEVRQRISEPALTTCDACGGEVRRLLSPAPFILKGGGWYVTDYPSESRKKAMESEKPATKDGTGGKDGKPEAAKETKVADTPAKPASDSASTTGASAAASSKSTTD